MGLDDITSGELRSMLRQHALIVQPGEMLVIQVPPDWSVGHVTDLQNAIRAYCEDPSLGPVFRVLVVPGTAVTVAAMPSDPFGEADEETG